MIAVLLHWCRKKILLNLLNEGCGIIPKILINRGHIRRHEIDVIKFLPILKDHIVEPADLDRKDAGFDIFAIEIALDLSVF